MLRARITTTLRWHWPTTLSRSWLLDPTIHPTSRRQNRSASVYHQGEIYIQEERMIFLHDAMARAHKDERNLIPYTNSHRPLKTPLSRTLTTK